MENEMLCNAMQEIITGMPMGERAVMEEAVRRLRLTDCQDGNRIVMLGQKLIELRKFAEHLVSENSELKARLESGCVEMVLHVQYDLEDEGVGAELQQGQSRYTISNLALAELLEARRDGRLVILPKEETV